MKQTKENKTEKEIEEEVYAKIYAEIMANSNIESIENIFDKAIAILKERGMIKENANPEQDI